MLAWSYSGPFVLRFSDFLLHTGKSPILRRTLSIASKSRENVNRLPLSQERVGDASSSEFRVYLTSRESGQRISAWHDVPLFRDKAGQPGAATLNDFEADYDADDGFSQLWSMYKAPVLHYVSTTPKRATAALKVALGERQNPIEYDLVDDMTVGSLRSVIRRFGTPIGFNCGILPQTWQPSFVIDSRSELPGDGGAVDAVEIGARPISPGDVVQVRPIAALAVLEDGRTDWKILVINVREPGGGSIQSIEDVDERFPHLLGLIREWFRVYRVPQGYEPNEFAVDGDWLDAEVAMSVVEHAKEQWQRALADKSIRSADLWFPPVTGTR